MMSVLAKARHRKGSVLIFVLAIIVLLSVLAMRLLEETVREMEHVSQFHRRDDLRLQAYSALEVALGVLEEWKMVEGQLFSPSQGWANPLSYAEIQSSEAGVKWAVRIEDETGKIPFGSFKEKDLVVLFALMVKEEDGLLNERDGEPFVDCLLDWQDKDDDERDDGEEEDYYEDLEPPYFPPNDKLTSFEEFRHIKGFSYDFDDPDGSGLFFDELGNETSNFRHFRSTVSFHNGYPVNINTAPDYLLRFLCGDDDRGYEQILDVLSGKDPSVSEPFFRNSNDSKLSSLRRNRSIELGAECKIFRIHITVSKGPSNFRLHALLESGRSSSGGTAVTPGPARSVPSARIPNTRTSKSKNRGRGPLDPNFSKLQYPFRIIALRENENLVD
jgi:general secretion pathway protein K